jgi:periplasmic copper chaperone A
MIRFRGRPLRRWVAAPALLALVACNGGSVEQQPGADVHVHDAWARPVHAAAAAPADTHAHGASMHDMHAQHAAGAANGAVYLTLRNAGLEADRLVRVESPVARAAEIHQSQIEDGIMRMRQVEGVSLPAGESVTLQPGGLHVMLVEVNRPLQPGDRFPLVLNFEKNGAREVEVEVRSP